MKFKLFIIILLSLLITNIFSTEQQRDRIKYQNNLYELSISPIIRYFDTHPDITFRKSEIHDSGLYRGYYTHYEVINNKLYITSINIIVQKENSNEDFFFANLKVINIINEIFPKDTLFLDWFSGVLILHETYLNKVDNEEKFECKLLEFKNGILIKESYIYEEDLYDYELMKYADFKKTNEYEALTESIYNTYFSGRDKSKIGFYDFFKSRHINFIQTIE